MNNYRIFLIPLFHVALTTELAFAQPEQWPPRYDNNVITNTNYVSPNYNPYIYQRQYRYQGTLQNYNTVATPIIPLYGNSVVMPPPVMTYNPMLPGYGVLPVQNFPLQYFPFPMFNYSGWTY